MGHTTRRQGRRAWSRRERAFRRWAAGLICAVGSTAAIATATVRGAAPTTPAARRPAATGFEFLKPLRGASGRLKAAFRRPGDPLIVEPPPGLRARYERKEGAAIVSPTFEAPHEPGVYSIAIEVEEARNPVEDIRLITLVPFGAKNDGRIGAYRVGHWPYEQGGAPSSAYANPAGFVEVTPENRNLAVSEHFTLGDFLTKDQPTVWPKYLVLDAKLIDKLELVIDELENEGYTVAHLAIMSGFRTPRYNGAGGKTSGRASLSRHMYGDATDVFVDNDRNGWTDDVNRDGKVDIRDAEVVARAAERAEAQHPDLVGGIGIYAATRAHGPFTHVDARGRRAGVGREADRPAGAAPYKEENMLNKKTLAAVSAMFLVAGVACKKDPPVATAPRPAPPSAAATVSDVTLGNAIDADKKIVVPIGLFGPQDTIYASVETVGAGSSKLRALWSFVKGDDTAKVDETTIAVGTAAPAVNEFHVSKPSGWPAGDYRVEIFLGDSAAPAASRTFRVGCSPLPGGSSPTECNATVDKRARCSREDVGLAAAPRRLSAREGSVVALALA